MSINLGDLLELNKDFIYNFLIFEPNTRIFIGSSCFKFIVSSDINIYIFFLFIFINKILLWNSLNE